MIQKYVAYVGFDFVELLFKVKKEKSEEKVEKYLPAADLKVAERYLSYLKEIHSYQQDRRTTIENKNSQLVGQASIVTSIFALFIPLLFENLSGVTLWVKVPLSILFLFVIFHYLLSILHAIKTLTVDKYKYPSRSTLSITKTDRKESELDFVNCEIADLVYIISKTTPIDNIKGSNLIFGARCFKLGNIGFGLMAVFVLALTTVLKNDVPSVTVDNLKEFSLVGDTIKTRLINFQGVDTVTVKIDSLKTRY